MAQETDASQAPPTAPARALLPFILPAGVVGVVASLVFVGVSTAAERLQRVLWGPLPDALGLGRYSVPWMFAVLVATGIAVGLVVWKAPGHAGPDPATLALNAPALAPVVLPGLVAGDRADAGRRPEPRPGEPGHRRERVPRGLARRRLLPRTPGTLWPVPAESATIGALFGTPVAAAMVISEALAGRPMRGRLWDNLFAPLTAGACGAVTTTLVARPTFDLGLPPMGHPRAKCAVYAFPLVHAAFRGLRHPMLMLPAGGVVLGALGTLGGRLTLFKGLSETGELARHPQGWSAGQFAGMAVVKPAALLVAASCGFRGGRIFPAVFVGAALGLCAHALVPAVHPEVGVAAAVLGMLLAITRQGWVSLFTAAVLVASPAVLALLCIASLPAWLLVTGRPQMQLRDDGTPIR